MRNVLDIIVEAARAEGPLSTRALAVLQQLDAFPQRSPERTLGILDGGQPFFISDLTHREICEVAEEHG
jgi:hypothetical protein